MRLPASLAASTICQSLRARSTGRDRRSCDGPGTPLRWPPAVAWSEGSGVERSELLQRPAGSAGLESYDNHIHLKYSNINLFGFIGDGHGNAPLSKLCN